MPVLFVSTLSYQQLFPRPGLTLSRIGAKELGANFSNMTDAEDSTLLGLTKSIAESIAQTTFNRRYSLQMRAVLYQVVRPSDS